MTEFNSLDEAWKDLLRYSPDIANAAPEVQATLRSGFFAGAFASIAVMQTNLDKDVTIGDCFQKVVTEIVNEKNRILSQVSYN